MSTVDRSSSPWSVVVWREEGKAEVLSRFSTHRVGIYMGVLGRYIGSDIDPNRHSEKAS